MLAEWFNDALIAPEMTGGYGYPLIQFLRRIGYFNVYTQKRGPESVRGGKPTRYGFWTSDVTRPLILSKLRRILRIDPQYLYSRRLKGEMRTFKVARSGRAQAAPGAHDDVVMAWAIAWHLAEQYAGSTVEPLDDGRPAAYAARANPFNRGL
jgi:phage terminase large subunit